MENMCVFIMSQEVLQKLLKDPVIQESRKRQEGEPDNTEGFITGELSGKSALQVNAIPKASPQGWRSCGAKIVIVSYTGVKDLLWCLCASEFYRLLAIERDLHAKWGAAVCLVNFQPFVLMTYFITFVPVALIKLFYDRCVSLQTEDGIWSVQAM